MMKMLSMFLALLSSPSKVAAHKPVAPASAPIEPTLADLHKLRGRQFGSLTNSERLTFIHFTKHADGLGLFVELLDGPTGPVMVGADGECQGYVFAATLSDLDAMSGRQFDSLTDVERGVVTYFLERSQELGVFVALIGAPPQSLLNKARTPAEFDAVLQGDHPRIVVTSEAQMLSLPIGRTGAVNLLSSSKSGASQ